MIKNLYKYIIVFSFCGVVVSFVDASEIGVYDAWVRVQSVNGAIKASKNAKDASALKTESAKSMYLPKVTISGSYTHLSDPIHLSGDIDLSLLHKSFSYNIDLSEQNVFLANLHALWPLYTGGKIDAMQAIYKANVVQQDAMLEMKKDEEFLKLVKYYYGVVVSRSLYETSRHYADALKIHYENAKKMKEQGQIADIELLNAKVKLDEANVELTKAKHKFEIASSAFALLIKSDDKVSCRFDIAKSLQDEEFYQNKTKHDFKALKVLDAKKKQSEMLLKIKKADFYPTVSGFANYNLYRDDSVLMQTLPKWFAGVMVSIDILKRSDRSQEIKIAQMRNKEVEYLKEDALQNLEILVQKTYKEMMLYKEEYYSLNSTVKLAQENYRLRDLSFKEGLCTSVELVDARTILLGAKTKQLNALYNFIEKLSQLCVLSGDRDMFFKFMGVEG